MQKIVLGGLGALIQRQELRKLTAKLVTRAEDSTPRKPRLSKAETSCDKLAGTATGTSATTLHTHQVQYYTTCASCQV